MFRDAGLLEDMTYGKVMKILRRAKKAKSEEGGEWELVKTAPAAMKVLQTLDLMPKPSNPPKRKRGRPRKTEPQEGV